MLRDPKASSVWLIMAGSTGAGGCLHVWRDMVEYKWSTPSSRPAPRSSTWISSKRSASSTTRRNADDDTLLARSTSTASTTPTSTKKSCSTSIRRSTKICDALEPRPYSSREFIYEIGKWLAAGNAKKKDSLIQRAYEKACRSSCRRSPIARPASASSSTRSSAAKPRSRTCHHRQRRRLPRAHRDQDRGAGTTGPVHGRRRRAEELRAGHRRLRRNPRPRRCRSAQIRRADHRRRRARRRLLVLDAQGSAAGARSTPCTSRWCSPKRPRSRRSSPPTPTTRARTKAGTLATSRSSIRSNNFSPSAFQRSP